MTQNDRQTAAKASAKAAQDIVERLRLPARSLAHRVDPASFPFETTDELTSPEIVPGQERALDAIAFALAMEGRAYNLVAIGPDGLHIRGIVERLLQERAEGRPASTEYCYVNNFGSPHKPLLLAVPSGRGSILQNAMARFVADVKTVLKGAFSSDDYRSAVEMIEREVAEVQSKGIGEVGDEAERRGLALFRTPVGFGFAPTRDGKALMPDEFQKLSKEEQDKIKSDTEELEQKLHSVLKQMPKVIGEAQEKTKALNAQTAQFSVAHLIERIKLQFQDLPQVTDYLERVEDDVIRNAEAFLSAPDAALGEAVMWAEGPTLFWRYRVNLLVDHGQNGLAPIIFEDEPSFERLLGRIEHRSERGALVTDFNLIRPGSLHVANGGYLLIDMRRLLSQPLAWSALKRVLEAGEIRIESLSSAMGFTSTTTLEPEPAPLDVKIILTGERLFYYLLSAHDPDFRNYFKVLADFDDAAPNDEEVRMGFAGTLAAFAKRESLRPFDRSGVAALIDLAVRRAGDARKLSADSERMEDLMREADFIASRRERSVVSSDDVKAAYAADVKRKSRVSERLQEAMERRSILIDTEGAKTGQVNGLSVFQLGDLSFGKPSRITARVSIGSGDVVDIEREVAMGGPIHSKGVLILSGYLRARYAPDFPLSLAASLVFEQSYGGVEGDSASAAELLALLSALAETPVNQSLAITGSVNQNGEIQVIGGVNEKIEGFFDLCALRGLTGDQGVIIPADNVQNLVLDDRVLEAIEQARFHLYAASTIDECVAVLTGIEPGEAAPTGDFPEGTFNARVRARMIGLAERRREFVRDVKEPKGRKS